MQPFLSSTRMPQRATLVTMYPLKCSADMAAHHPNGSVCLLCRSRIDVTAAASAHCAAGINSVCSGEPN